MLSRKRAAELLMEAAELINGERSKDYGEPDQSFKNIAKLWSTYLGIEITVTDVGMLMILLKVSRNGRKRFKRDNFLDICGYASLLGSDDPMVAKAAKAAKVVSNVNDEMYDDENK